MANWDKLDKEFYEVIDNLSDEQWESWEKQQSHNQKLRKFKKELELQIHLLKLKYKPLIGQKIISQTNIGNVDYSSINKINIDFESTHKFALAA